MGRAIDMERDINMLKKEVERLVRIAGSIKDALSESGFAEETWGKTDG